VKEYGLIARLSEIYEILKTGDEQTRQVDLSNTRKVHYAKG